MTVDVMFVTYDDIMKNLQQKPNTIEEYMVIHNYLKSEQLKTNSKKIN